MPIERTAASRLIAPHSLTPARRDERYRTILRLQRDAGNRAVASLLAQGAQSSDAARLAVLQSHAADGRVVKELVNGGSQRPIVSRSPEEPQANGGPTKGRPAVLGQDYEDWSPKQEESNVKAALTRDTKLLASRWLEMEPGRLRVEYKQDATIYTRDRRRGGVVVDLTVFLDPRGPLPRSRGAAVAAKGVRTSGVWTSWGDGDGYEEISDGRSMTGRSGQSLQDLAEEFPEFARLYLPVKQQEVALLRYLDKLRKLTTQPGVVGPDLPSGHGGRSGKSVRDGGASSDDSMMVEVVKDAADVITDFIPGISNAKDFYTFWYGKTVRGQKVGWLDRLLSLIFAIPGIGNLAGYIKKGASVVAKHVIQPLIRHVKKKFPRITKWLETKLVLMNRAAREARIRKKIAEVVGKLDGQLDDIGAGDRQAIEAVIEEALKRKPANTSELAEGLVGAGGKHAEEIKEILGPMDGPIRKNAEQLVKLEKELAKELEAKARIRADLAD